MKVSFSCLYKAVKDMDKADTIGRGLLPYAPGNSRVLDKTQMHIQPKKILCPFIGNCKHKCML